MVDSDRFLTHTLRQQSAGASVTRILSAALRAVDPVEAVNCHVRRDGGIVRIADASFRLSAYKRILVIAFGKASLPMMDALAEIMRDCLAGGVVISKHVAGEGTGHPAVVMEGGHPIPDARSLAAGKKVMELLSGLSSNDLVICLISGGGSALMSAPVEGVTLADLQKLTSALLACGASIDEINTLRRRLDLLKGGGLARQASPARIISLILSDVVGNPLETIASGPTAPDSATKKDAMAIIEKYGLRKEMSAAVLSALENGPETLKPGDPLLENVQNILVGSNIQAAQGALKQAEEEGFHPYLLRTDITGEAGEAAVELCRFLRYTRQTGKPVSCPACIVAGGETTVTLRNGAGRGGRNQELALAAVNELVNLPDVMLITFATDGEDGPTDAAGAIVTGETYARACALDLDPVAYLANHDSYAFFSTLDELIKIGPTGTNVGDLIFMFTL